jgi:hypothetical protein
MTASADSDTDFLNSGNSFLTPTIGHERFFIALQDPIKIPLSVDTISFVPTMYGFPIPWTGNLADLGKLEGYENIYPVAMDGLGLVVGSSSTSDNSAYVASIWNNGVPTDLNSFLDSDFKIAGWTLIKAVGIAHFDEIFIFGEAKNSITGENKQFVNLGTQVGISSAPVPEADTSAMLLMGAGVMGFMARRRKNTQA